MRMNLCLFFFKPKTKENMQDNKLIQYMRNLK